MSDTLTFRDVFYKYQNPGRWLLQLPSESTEGRLGGT